MTSREVATTVTRYGDLAYFTRDYVIGASLSKYGEWAQVEIELLLSFIHPGDTVIDAGANIGTHTLAFAERVGPTGHVVAFEPQADVFQLLETNVRKAGLAQVQLNHAAVGAKPGRLSVPPLDLSQGVNAGGLSLVRSDVLAPNATEVDVTPLDALGLTRCNAVKIDVEGMEEQVLRGMARTIRQLRPVVLVECNTVDSGIASIQAGDWTDYATYLVRTSSFNPSNFRGVTDNAFGWAMETALLFLPLARVDDIPESTKLAEILPVSDFTSLAQALLETPKWEDVTPYDRVSPKRLAEMNARMSRDQQTLEEDPALQRQGPSRRELDQEEWAARAGVPGLVDLVLEARDETVRQARDALARTERKLSIYEATLGLAVTPVLIRRGFLRLLVWLRRSWSHD